MFDKYNVWTMVIILGVCLYLFNERKQIRAELRQIDALPSNELKQIRLLRLLIQLASAVFVCLTFIFTLLAITLYFG